MASWDDIKENLEPLGKHFYTTPYHDVHLSIAISLKRIADKLELSQKQPIVMDAEQYRAYEAGKKL
jgi:hypothetical protein